MLFNNQRQSNRLCRHSLTAMAAVTLSLAAWACMAQPPGGPGGPGGRAGGPGGPSSDRGGRPEFPLIKALDADGDHVISASEIEASVIALKSLDKNGDGKLTDDEFQPQFGRRGPGRERGGPGGPGGKPGEEGRRGRQGGPQGAEFENRRSPEQMVERIMGFDENGDGELSQDELPERLQSMLSRADADESNSLSKSEIEAMANRFAEGGPGGGRGRERGQRAGKSRPKRPPVE